MAYLTHFDAIVILIRPAENIMKTRRKTAQTFRQFKPLQRFAGNVGVDQPARAKPFAQRERLGIRPDLVALQFPVRRAVEGKAPFVLLQEVSISSETIWSISCAS
ncbi:MAG: hypothetical protein M5R42_19095 [Rhodocyclaceae bacterium]|nr:hypothetical protein [Rhodocyclaceae bacterium]